MMYLTGDTHTEWMQRLSTKRFPQQKDMTKDDYVVILGDFGIWDHSKQQRYALDWLEDKPFTTLFLDGNHENFDILDALPVRTWHGGHVHEVRPSILHLMRGQVFTFHDETKDCPVTVFTFGGGSSHDVKAGILEPDDPDRKAKEKALRKKYDPYPAPYRVNHESWWEQELPDRDQMEEGKRNLRDRNFRVDYVFTHSPYTSLVNRMGHRDTDVLTDYLQEIKQATDYKAWFFGHMHVDQDFYHERACGFYERITRLI